MHDRLLQVCDWMLAPQPQDRPQNVAELRAAISGHFQVPQRVRQASANSWQSTVVQMDDGELGASAFGPSELPVPRAQAERSARARPIWAAGVVMVMVAAFGSWWAATRSPLPGAGIAFAAPTAAAVAGAAGRPAANPAATRDDASVAEQPKADQPAGARPAAALPAPAVRPQAAMATRSDNAPARVQAAVRPKATPARVGDGSAAARAETTAAQPVAVPAGPTSNAATEATPGQAPVSVAVVTHNPREHCSGRHLLALHRCLVRECEKPEYAAHRECQRVRDIEADTRAVLDNN
jgi:hypothetical protein